VHHLRFPGIRIEGTARSNRKQIHLSTIETLTRERDERSKKSRVFVNGGRTDHHSHRHPRSFRPSSSSLKSLSHHSRKQFANEKTRLKLQSRSQDRNQATNRRQRHHHTCKLQVGCQSSMPSLRGQLSPSILLSLNTRNSSVAHVSQKHGSPYNPPSR